MELRDLADRLAGDVVLPADEAWATARQAWNLAVDSLSRRLPRVRGRCLATDVAARRARVEAGVLATALATRRVADSAKFS